MTRAPRGGTLRAIGIAAARVGLGLGGYFSLHAMSKHDDARPECSPDETSCSSRGMVDYGAAVDSANNATIAFAIGGTLLVGGDRPLTHGAARSGPFVGRAHGTFRSRDLLLGRTHESPLLASGRDSSRAERVQSRARVGRSPADDRGTVYGLAK